MKPAEHKTVQARVLAYAQEIGWSFVFREEAERRRGFAQGGGSSSLDETTGWKTRSPVPGSTDRNVRAPLPKEENGAQGTGAQGKGARVFQPVEVKVP
jgi:hypothetical protein